ncbi:SDR family oxidoreductase [Sphingobacterium sp. SRCM116780]|uniref:NAD(P)-dependent oxidoreductase n=1 Tax=Sphingobacterium sp. SRCM116780 TaxID=2907623 RepID=UPI001F17DF7B|nr:SDR family oxidoreductase [Sphingobacterium sp. SRCM116780]UIR57417.1 SDR family oxidoreductase [Sphingobacterium sp. SRCM116780]
MKVIIFGATGTVGIEIVRQALAMGHEVTAFVRNPEKLVQIKDNSLSIYPGDVAHLPDVEEALNHQDAVLCALGDGKVGKIRGIGTHNIIQAMDKMGIKRLICQTTLGMGESYGNLNFIWKHIMFGMLLKKAFQDHQAQEHYILNSQLDYTLVRPSALIDGAVTKGYQVGFDGKYKKLSLKITRADVADFMLRQLESRDYSKKAVSISN